MHSKTITFFIFSFLSLSVLSVSGQEYLGAGVADVPKIYVAGIGSVTTFPNAAQLTLALKFTKPTLREAIDENQKTAEVVQAVIKKYVKDPAEIRVSLISTSKTMRYDQALKKEVLAGYESSQKIIFTLNDLASMQDFTEEILKTRIYEIEHIAYFHTEAASFTKKAQEMAVSDAIETTQRLAKAGNIKLGKIIFMETTSSPTESESNTVNSYNLRTYNKGMGGQGVSASGQLITYSARVAMYTKID